MKKKNKPQTKSKPPTNKKPPPPQQQKKQPHNTFLAENKQKKPFKSLSQGEVSADTSSCLFLCVLWYLIAGSFWWCSILREVADSRNTFAVRCCCLEIQQAAGEQARRHKTDFAINTGRKLMGDTGYLHSYTLTRHGNQAGNMPRLKIWQLCCWWYEEKMGIF